MSTTEKRTIWKKNQRRHSHRPHCTYLTYSHLYIYVYQIRCDLNTDHSIYSVCILYMWHICAFLFVFARFLLFSFLSVSAKCWDLTLCIHSCQILLICYFLFHSIVCIVIVFISTNFVVVVVVIILADDIVIVTFSASCFLFSFNCCGFSSHHTIEIFLENTYGAKWMLFTAHMHIHKLLILKCLRSYLEKKTNFLLWKNSK